MLSYCVVGVGNLGASIANYLVTIQVGGGNVALYEPHVPNQPRAEGEYLDLLPIAAAHGVTLTNHQVLPVADVYVITCGLPRKNASVPKSHLVATNLPIVRGIVDKIPRSKRVYIATNPPKEICQALGRGIPLRDCTDRLRACAGNADELNRRALELKGFTAFTPGYAMARQLLIEGRI